MVRVQKYHREADYYILEQHEEDNAITTDAKRG